MHSSFPSPLGVIFFRYHKEIRQYQRGRLFPSPLGVIFFRYERKNRIENGCKGFRPLSGLFFSDKLTLAYILQGGNIVSVPSRGYFFPIMYQGGLLIREEDGFRPLSGLFFSDTAF